MVGESKSLRFYRVEGERERGKQERKGRRVHIRGDGAKRREVEGGRICTVTFF